MRSQSLLHVVARRTPLVAVSHSDVAKRRVYEVARQLDMPTSSLISHLRARGVRVLAASSLLPPGADSLLDEIAADPRTPPPLPAPPPRPRPPASRYWDWEGDSRWKTYRFTSWIGPDEVTAKEAAEAYEVTPATIRQWVRRGHLQPSRVKGRTHLFAARDVNRAAIATSHRDKQPRDALSGRLSAGAPIPLAHVDGRSMQAVLTADDASRLLNVPAATIRSWRHRSLLQPLYFDGRTPMYRIADIVAVARRPPHQRKR